ncbi:MAG: hypothetical protein WBP51_02860 [Candidatus Sulfotelmatobacter sp.]
MTLRLEPYTAGHIRQVRDFNERLRQGGVDAGFLLPESTSAQEPADLLEKRPGAPFVKRQFLALEDDHVRGGFLLQEQPCVIAGEARWCANIQMPISEGLIDRKFSYVATRMLQILLRAHPFVFAVGMGHLEAPFARFLSAMKWRVALVPFRFFVFRPARFLLEIQRLHTSTVRSIAANVGAWSGLGASVILAAQRLRRRHAADLIPDRIYRWEDQTSSLWSQYRAGCSFAAARDGETLPFFLDLTDRRLSAYRLTDRGGTLRGWIVLQVTAMDENQHFGSLRVATLLDGVCAPMFERAAVGAATACARDQGADVILLNQQHRHWIMASDENGFWKGPSNYVLATSPRLTEQIGAVDPEFTKVHISRSDGDGRLNL